MYVSFMKEVSQIFKNKYGDQIIRDLSFESMGLYKEVLQFINKFGLKEYTHIFDLIGIKYDRIYDNGLSYTVNNLNLTLDELSSSERLLLYSNIRKSQNKPIIILGLLERLDYKHLQILQDMFDNYNKMVILTFQSSPYTDDIINKYYKPFYLIEKELFS